MLIYSNLKQQNNNIILVIKHAGISQQIDKRIVAKINQLVAAGVREVREMQRHIIIFVNTDLFRGRQFHRLPVEDFIQRKKTSETYVYRGNEITVI